MTEDLKKKIDKEIAQSLVDELLDDNPIEALDLLDLEEDFDKE